MSGRLHPIVQGVGLSDSTAQMANGVHAIGLRRVACIKNFGRKISYAVPGMALMIL